METPRRCEPEVSERLVDSRWSWVIAVACCFANCMLYGVSRLSGMLLHPAIETYGVSRGAAALPFSTSSAVRNLSGPIVGFLGQHFGIRPVAAIGCVLASLGTGLCFFTSDIIWATICWGGIFGIGLGLSTSLLPSAINQNFDKHAATASGISYSGSYIGSFIFPPLVFLLLDKYGLPETFLVLSGFILNSLVAVVLLRPPCWNNSTSNNKTVYTIDSEKGHSDPSSLQEIRIDEFAAHGANRHQVRVTDQTGLTNNENTHENVSITEHFDEKQTFCKLCHQRSTSVSKSGGKSGDVFCDKIETSDECLGLLMFAKNSVCPDSFLLQELRKIPNLDKEEHGFFMNIPLKDIILKICEHTTSTKKSSGNFTENGQKTDTLHLGFNDSRGNSYLLLQLSDRDTQALITELGNKHHGQQLHHDKLSPENHGDLILWGIFREHTAGPEAKSLTNLQKFTMWRMVSGYDIVNISQNASGLRNFQVSYRTTATERKSSFQNPGSTPLLDRLTRSFKGRRTSRTPAVPICKSLSLDSGSYRPASVESPCFQCCVTVRACASVKPVDKICELFSVPLHFPWSELRDTSVTLNNAIRFVFEICKLPCKCTPLRTSADKMPSHITEEHFANSPNPIVFANEEKSFKDVNLTSLPDLPQLQCVAIILLPTARNNRVRDLNLRITSSRDGAANLNNQTSGTSIICPDQNHNFLDSADEAENAGNSKVADFSGLRVNGETRRDRHVIFRKRLRSWCSVFSNPMFLLISVTMAVYSFVMVCVITVVEDYARDIEHPNIPKPYVLMVLSAADLCGTLGLGWITDRGFVTKRNFVAICFCGLAVSIMAIAFATQVITLCIFVAIYGTFESGIVITFPLLIAQFVRVDKQTMAIASSNVLSAPAILLVPFVIGYCRDYMGSYRTLFWLLSVTSGACGFLWLLVPCLLRKYTLRFRGRIS